MRRFVPLLALALVVVTAQPSAAQRTGGVLKAGMISEPPSLDIHWTTAVITQQITWHAVETLYTYDRVFNVVPMLAEGHTAAVRPPPAARPPRCTQAATCAPRTSAGPVVAMA